MKPGVGRSGILAAVADTAAGSGWTSCWTGLANDKFSVVCVTDFAVLEEISASWTELAAAALEPNPFYESWMLGPALSRLRDGADLRVVLVFAPNGGPNGAPNRARSFEPFLCGVFPLERRPRHKRIPSRTPPL